MMSQRDIDLIDLQANMLADEIEEEFNLMLAGERRAYLEQMIEQFDQGEVENASEKLLQLLRSER